MSFSRKKVGYDICISVFVLLSGPNHFMYLHWCFITQKKGSKMGSNLLASWSLDECRRECEKHFKFITFDQLCNPQTKLPKLSMIKVVYMYSTMSNPKFSTWQPRKGNTPDQKVVSDFNRFHAFGIPASPNVLLAFSEKESDSRNLLRVTANLHPGSELSQVWL